MVNKIKIILLIVLFFNNINLNTINFNNKPNPIIGQIIINDKKLNIVKGHEKKLLNKNLVGAIIDKNNIILAGHNHKDVFNIITKLNINDKLILKINNNYNIYQVSNIYHLKNNEDFHYNKNKKEVNLITCIDNNEKRLIVSAIKVE